MYKILLDRQEKDVTGLFECCAIEAPSRSRFIKLTNYKMDHSSRGKAIIFNHKHFKYPYVTRKGTKADVQNLQQTLPKLGFQEEDIIVYNDLPFFDIITTLKEVSLEDHTNNDLLMVFVLTHGHHNDKIMAYDEAYSVEQIWSYFTADKCESLAGKPKIFFIVACRGDLIDRGRALKEGFTIYEEQSSTQVDAIAFQPSFGSYVIPIWSDFLCVFSSYKGYYSYRNKITGTWFVQAFCKQASETDFNKVSFTDFLTGVNGQIARTFQTHPLDLRKQTSVSSSTLTRLLYLKRKELEEEKIKEKPKEAKLETQL